MNADRITSVSQKGLWGGEGKGRRRPLKPVDRRNHEAVAVSQVEIKLHLRKKPCKARNVIAILKCEQRERERRGEKRGSGRLN